MRPRFQNDYFVLVVQAENFFHKLLLQLVGPVHVTKFMSPLVFVMEWLDRTRKSLIHCANMLKCSSSLNDTEVTVDVIELTDPKEVLMRYFEVLFLILLTR